jgi:hypothetical protein
MAQLQRDLFVTIEQAQVGMLQIEDAVCFGQFNRRVLSYNETYKKPPCLVQALRELYIIGQDGSVPTWKLRRTRKLQRKRTEIDANRE